MGLLGAIRRETIYITSIARTLWNIRHVKADGPLTIVDIVRRVTTRTPHAIAILFEDRTVTYAELEAGANQYARWGIETGIRQGDVVGLLMENRPEYIMAWLGMAKIGAITALVNTNQRGTPLAHSISIAGAKHFILGMELADAYGEIAASLSSAPKVWITGGRLAPHEELDPVLARVSTDDVGDAWRKGIVGKDIVFYIFTSGTTGLPKAANISHMRMLYMMYGFACGLNAKASDRMYNTLPLYHTAGGICALGPALTTGGSVVIRRRFSVHEFWDDCQKYKPTLFQYIGELCRYLLNAPTNPYENKHAIRAITGNGLRPEIWPAFQKRFAIPRIVEFYGATEGNVSMLNYDGTVGAVGRLPSYMRGIMQMRIVKFDVENEMPVRGPDGFCIECQDSEPGEAIGKISNMPGRNFEGYTKAADTQKKILQNVFEQGDSWFRTGDLLRREAHGYIYFVDRIGDTFRWKGENVATSEVAEALGVIPGVEEANVYGVSIPGMDGRAGMAAIVAAPEFDPSNLVQALAGKLPAYARPIFIRLRPQMEITGTFKMRKVELVKEGFDPSHIDDPLYMLDPGAQRYVPLDAARYGDIVAGRVKL